jgi:RimJ/RimL family protein N-acetyltransferase
VTTAAVFLAAAPERVQLDDDVVIRTYAAEDMPQLVDVVNRQLDHLRPFMPWAQEPVTVEAQTAWWRGTMQPRDDGTGDVAYGIFAMSGALLGGTGYHLRGAPGVVEIGYWLSADATGRGLMTRVTAALVDVARQLDGVQRVEIKCDETNTRSAAIPRRLGFRLARVEAREPAAAAETGCDQVWVLDLSSSG